MNHDPRSPLLPDDGAPSHSLAPALARLREDLGSVPVPPSLWRRIEAHAHPLPALQPVAAGGPTLGSRGTAWSTWAALAAAGLALALVWFAGPGRQRLATPAPAPAQPGLSDGGGGAISAGPVGRVPRASGFVPVASPERFAELWQGGAEAAPAWVVHTELSRDRLASLGLPYDPARAGELVHAELLMHPSGDVLAVRLTR
jgi:hypothetical protein